MKSNVTIIVTGFFIVLTFILKFNHNAFADNHVTSFCMKPVKKPTTHNECLSAIQNGQKLYQNCHGGWGDQCGALLNIFGEIPDNSLRFIYNKKWFLIKNSMNKEKKRLEMQCLVWDLVQCEE